MQCAAKLTFTYRWADSKVPHSGNTPGKFVVFLLKKERTKVARKTTFLLSGCYK